MKNWMAIIGLLAACASAPRPTQPFKGAPLKIPGTIEAEDFDEGPAGIAYLDREEKNQGAPYRPGQVDIEKRPDASGGYGVGWTKAGEWLVYTVDVTQAGTYSVEIPVASKGKGGVFHLEFDGVDRSGPIDVPDTGSWQVLKVIRKDGLQLRSGLQTLKVVMDGEGASKSVADIDLFRFIRN